MGQARQDVPQRRRGRHQGGTMRLRPCRFSPPAARRRLSLGEESGLELPLLLEQERTEAARFLARVFMARPLAGQRAALFLQLERQGQSSGPFEEQSCDPAGVLPTPLSRGGTEVTGGARVGQS